MEYQILTANSSSSLEESVNKKIAEGWKLQGGLSVTESKYIDEPREYAQAMIKE